MNWTCISRFKMMGTLLVLALLVAVPMSIYASDCKHFPNHHSHYFLTDPIKTHDGYVSGAIIGDPGKEVRIYKGIPYAAPPVGDLRWRPPEPVSPWDGVLDATDYRLIAAQNFPTIPWWGSVDDSGMSEDCLYLNIVTPAKLKNERLPVMVYAHGGGLSSGRSNTDRNNNPNLPLHGVVSVTVLHRVGVLGFMAHPGLTAESHHGASGNYGMLDLLAALQWVKKNIVAFGGDPNNVTFWGHSGGGTKTTWMLASPLAKGLFNRAIIEAGVFYSADPPSASCKSLANAEAAGTKVGTLLNAPTIADLRKKTWQEIVKAAYKSGSGYSDAFTIDGWSLKDSTYNTFKAGKQNDVPIMVGCGAGETGPRTLLSRDGLQQWAEVLPTGKSNVFVYQFAHVPAGWSDYVTAWHGLECAYQFGSLDRIWFHAGNMFLPPPGLPADPGLDELDTALADIVQSIWARFAETGNPSIKGLVRWPAFGLGQGEDKYLDIALPLEVKPGFMDLQGCPVSAEHPTAVCARFY